MHSKKPCQQRDKLSFFDKIDHPTMIGTSHLYNKSPKCCSDPTQAVEAYHTFSVPNFVEHTQIVISIEQKFNG